MPSNTQVWYFHYSVCSGGEYHHRSLLLLFEKTSNINIVKYSLVFIWVVYCLIAVKTQQCT